MAHEVAQEILRQLGGKRFIVMTGSKNFVADKNLLGMKLARNSSGANYMRVKLNGLDLYDIEFLSIRGTNEPKVKHQFNDIYCDQLVNIFEETTGLYTSF